MNRTPPVEVREVLRKEVHFGCPIEGCGSPYLHYHHFDPPWNEKEHHNPEGMIALCKHHHPEAGNRAWTKEQLREIKNNPFIKDELSGRFNWLRQNILVMAGAIFCNPQVILEFGNEKVVWMQKDDRGYFRLNMLVRDFEDRIVLEIVDNDWVVCNERMIDIVCPPSGKKLSIVSKDQETNLAIRFDDVPINEFKKRLFSVWDKTDRLRKTDDRKHAKSLTEAITKRGMPKKEVEQTVKSFLAQNNPQNPKEEKERYATEIIVNIGSPQRVTTCTLNASLQYRGARIEIEDGIFCSGPIKMYRGFMNNCGIAYHFG
jgi:hypothetical protein